MKLNFYQSLIALVIIALSIASCKKDNNNKLTEDLAAIKESTVAADLTADIFIQLTAIASENRTIFASAKKSKKTQSLNKTFDSPSSCAALTATPLGKAYPKTITIDFGTGCTFNDVVHKGKLSAVFSAPMVNKNATIVVTLVNYYLNDTKFEGVLTITNNGLNANGNLNFNIHIAKANINNPDLNMSWESSGNVEWLKGIITSTSLDDEFAIRASTSGTTTKGEIFTAAIIKPLLKKAACRYITEGTVEYQLDSKPVQTLDYGIGECDNQASVTVNGKTTNITLRK